MEQRNALQAQFGQIDIYLFDQLLRGRITEGMTVLDAGCGYGRNLNYFLQHNYDVYAADENPEAISAVRKLASSLAPTLPASNFRVEPVEATSFTDESADAVISIAVLHFARDDNHFLAMLNGSWRVLKPGGLFICRLASNIGIESSVTQISGRRHTLPDGTDRYLVDEQLLLDLASRLGGRLLDPLKTTNVQNTRCMTTWVLHK